MGFPVTTAMGTGEIGVRLRLPEWQCDQCILQWTYTAGNSWGVGSDGVGGLGLGPQEHFRACADISIGGSVIVLPTLPQPTLPPATAAPPVPVSPAPGNGQPAPGAGQTCVAVTTPLRPWSQHLNQGPAQPTNQQTNQQTNPLLEAPTPFKGSSLLSLICSFSSFRSSLAQTLLQTLVELVSPQFNTSKNE